MPRHENNGKCPKCDALISERDVYDTLREWFRDLQERRPEVHISCAYRGKQDQEDAFDRGASKAHYGQSAHNYTPCAALDLFRLTEDGKAEWEVEWYQEVIEPELATNLTWGGNWVNFRDYPHVELTNWQHLKYTGQIKLEDD